MTAQLSRERLEEKLLEHIKHGGDSEEETMIRMLLAGMDSEPVAWTDEQELRDLEKSGCAYLFTVKPITPNADPRRVIRLYTTPPAPVADDYFASIVTQARARADKAMRKFPQPNYVLNKVAEESGEVIKAVIHYTEGREEWRNVEGEIIDNLAMLIRLVQEGDQVIGFTPPTDCRAAMLKQTCTCPSGDGSLRWPCPDHPPEPVTAATVPDDTKRLDWLDAQNKRLNEYYGTSYGWKFDANFQRNAMMLNDSNYPVMTVRQAIDEAMLAAAPAAPE